MAVFEYANLPELYADFCDGVSGLPSKFYPTPVGFQLYPATYAAGEVSMAVGPVSGAPEHTLKAPQADATLDGLRALMNNPSWRRMVWEWNATHNKEDGIVAKQSIISAVWPMWQLAPEWTFAVQNPGIGMPWAGIITLRMWWWLGWTNAQGYGFSISFDPVNCLVDMAAVGVMSWPIEDPGARYESLYSMLQWPGLGDSIGYEEIASLHNLADRLAEAASERGGQMANARGDTLLKVAGRPVTLLPKEPGQESALRRLAEAVRGYCGADAVLRVPSKARNRTRGAACQVALQSGLLVMDEE